MVTELLNLISEQRYLDSDQLTEWQQQVLAQAKGVIMEVYADQTKVFTLAVNYK